MINPDSEERPGSRRRRGCRAWPLLPGPAIALGRKRGGSGPVGGNLIADELDRLAGRNGYVRWPDAVSFVGCDLAQDLVGQNLRRQQLRPPTRLPFAGLINPQDEITKP